MEKYEVCIYSGKMADFSSEVKLAFGTEYGIGLHNNTSQRVVAYLEVDGVDEGALVLNPHSVAVIDNTPSNNRKLKFVSVDSKDAKFANTKVTKDTGFVRVRFKAEKVREWKSNSPFPNPQYPGIPIPLPQGPIPRRIDNGTISWTVNCSMGEVSGQNVTTSFDPPRGVTVRSDYGQTEYTYVDNFPLEEGYVTKTIKLVPKDSTKPKSFKITSMVITDSKDTIIS